MLEQPKHNYSLNILIAIAALGLTSNSIANAAPKKHREHEKPVNLSASQILPPEVVKGPYHTVADRVSSDGYFNNYKVISKFGTFDVEGRLLLDTRIGELSALAELDQLSSSAVFADAAYKAGKGIVLAPVTIVKKTVKHVSDPDKIADTLSAIPEGAEQLFSWVYRQGKGAVHAVGDAFSSSESDPHGESKKSKNESDKSAGEKVSGTVDQGASLGLKYLGYTKRQRQWFRKLKVNPYTTNELLRDEIMRVAGIETAVGTAFKFVPGLGLLGELSTFNTWYERAEKLSLYEDPETIGKKNQKELSTLGVPEEVINTFLGNKAYSPWARRFISASLTAIGSTVPGHTDFIRAACEAQNEPSTLYFVSVAEALEKKHAASPLEKIVAAQTLPAGVTKKGGLYLPLSVDYLFWTTQVDAIFQDFESKIVTGLRSKNFEVAIRGRASPLAMTSLRRMGASVKENAFE
jgi:hypothetical protein